MSSRIPLLHTSMLDRMLEKVIWKTGEATLQNVFEPMADPTLRDISQS
jgi:hypothetical protein